MGADNGAVDHGLLVVGISGQRLKHSLPYHVFGPAGEPPVRVLSVAETLREAAPRNSRAAGSAMAQARARYDS